MTVNLDGKLALASGASGDVGGDGVTATTVIPGQIKTARIDYPDRAKTQRESREVGEVTRESAAAIPVGRRGRPDKHGAAVAFLSSDSASHITGSSIRVDEGLIPSV